MIPQRLIPPPSRARDGAAVIRWEGDTWTTLREGRGTLVCYDHSGAAGEAAFSSQCTHPDNLERVAQNFRFEAQANGDRQALQALLAEAEANVHGIDTHFSDNYFTLLKNERKEIEVSGMEFDKNNLVIWSLYNLNK